VIHTWEPRRACTAWLSGQVGTKLTAKPPPPVVAQPPPPRGPAPHLRRMSKSGSQPTRRSTGG
jgi:hypothetical protein